MDTGELDNWVHARVTEWLRADRSMLLAEVYRRVASQAGISAREARERDRRWVRRAYRNRI